MEIQDEAVRAKVYGPLHESLVGQSLFVREVSELLERLAPAKLSVLVTGETGTGKDIVARLLHKRSPRREKPFIKVNSPAIARDLFESELFGYEKGAFTGATVSKPGLMELAHRGTIFLDEIAEISPEAQGKLVQVLDGEPFMRVGGVNPINVDVRVVAATNVPVDVTVENGRLRQDIAFRLNDFTIHMVPLRDRREDIPLLAEHFNYNYCKTYDKKYESIADGDLDTMSSQRWHGNVRELSARVKEYVVTGSRNSLLEEKAPVQRGMAASHKSGAQPAETEEKKPEKHFPSLKEARRQAVEATEKALIEEALEHTLWNRKKAARLLRISYSSLLRRIDTYQIDKV